MIGVSANKHCLHPLKFGAALLCATIFSGLVRAANDPGTFKAGTSGDAVCTRCHDANEKKPILSIHRTRHGVASQPGCQACHGSSRGHVQHSDDSAARPPPRTIREQ